ncbi:hypothetical protein Nepgr_033463 [Nepenthes gracilis]|uniref:Uncharacterized protein n=1 Tax=Nepenthes gracilis TaxID=150966 RepID=A0AAD3Y8P2_NEPGR|nr:hypothetical protein Nepgr_033463 [Nepenthes gracilis]
MTGNSLRKNELGFQSRTVSSRHFNDRHDSASRLQQLRARLYRNMLVETLASMHIGEKKNFGRSSQIYALIECRLINTLARVFIDRESSISAQSSDLLQPCLWIAQVLARQKQSGGPLLSSQVVYG